MLRLTGKKFVSSFGCRPNRSERATRGINAFVEGLDSADADIRTWAAFEAYQAVDKPSNRLIDAYLRRWPDPDVRGNTAAAIMKWRVKRAAPMLARRLREGGGDERAPAVRGLGGTGDTDYVAAVRAAFADESRFVQVVRIHRHQSLTGR